MNFTECMNILSVLHSEKYTEVSANLIKNIQINHKISNLRFPELDDHDDKFAYDQKNAIDTICFITFRTFFRVKEILQTTNENISLHNINVLKTSISNLSTLSICTNLVENLPGHKSNGPIENTIIEKYNRLCDSTDKLIKILKCEQLCDIVLNSCLSALITALYQILYAPIKRPPSQQEPKCEDSFVMSCDLYTKLTDDRGYFQDVVNILLMPKIKSQYVTAIMLLMKCKTPVWFQRAVSANLTSIMKDKGGIETIAVALLENTADYDPNDTSKIWRVLSVFVKLFLGFQTSADFTTNICQQLLDLLDAQDSQGNFIKPFELIVAKSIKELYLIDVSTAVDVLLKRVLSKSLLAILDAPNSDVVNGDRTSAIFQSTRILHNCFIDNLLDSADLPVSLLSPVVMSLLKLHARTVKCWPIINGQLKDLLLKYTTREEVRYKLFDAVLFNIGYPVNDVYLLRRDIQIDIDDINRIVVKNRTIGNVNEDLEEDLLNLLTTRTELLMTLFLYLFKCLVDKDKSSKNLEIYRSITKLTYNKCVLRHLNSNPECLIPHFESFLESSIKDKIHIQDSNTTPDESQPFFTVIMIVQLLAQSNLRDSTRLLDLLRVISKETNIAEIKLLISDVLSKLLEDKYVDHATISSESQENPEDGQVMISSEVDKAITDVCDPLLPVRAHGLMELTKLVEDRHPDVLKRKQYVFHVFQQNLKNEDSFIYLSAIGGLAAMGELCPDSILPLIAEEYADYTIQRAFEDEIELRLKLGEVLLRVTKALGDRAYKHKALLLNTFLKTTKDDDHLIRASSLSNVAEVCRVLGEKMGPIITEVLSCVQHVIETDAAPEPRRAAISVIRQMLVGTDKLMLQMLRDQMPVIYRTLQFVYKNDADEVARLQAQLALEQLDVNMRAILMPSESDEKSSVGEVKGIVEGKKDKENE